MDALTAEGTKHLDQVRAIHRRTRQMVQKRGNVPTYILTEKIAFSKTFGQAIGVQYFVCKGVNHQS